MKELERVKSFFRHYRSDRRGIIILASILFLAIAGVEIFRLVYEPKIERIDVLLVDQELPIVGDPVPSSEHRKENTPFPFNPNTLSDSGYAALGFSEKEIKTLRNYQAAGASFEMKRDFSKLFFVDEDEYMELESYIQLPESKPKKEYEQSYSKITSKPKVKWSDTASTDFYSYKDFTCNINTADTNELKRLNGIGSFYANRIIQYREELGGYHNIGQLKEIWEMTDDKIDKFADQLFLETADIIQFNINSVSAHELSQHPYVSFGQANKIVLKREELGRFTDSNAFLSSGLLDADLCRKLVPYLNFDE